MVSRLAQNLLIQCLGHDFLKSSVNKLFVFASSNVKNVEIVRYIIDMYNF